MTNRRYPLPIMATVIGLVVAGCGGGGDDDTISVTVTGPAISASERVLGIAAAIAPLLPGAVAPALRQITPAVERTAVGGVRVTVTAAPVGPDFEFPGQHAPRRCLEPGRIARQRDGIERAYYCLHEHREPEEAVRQCIYP